MRPGARGHLHAGNHSPALWLAAILLGLLSALIPVDPGSPVISPILTGTGIDARGIAGRLYELIKAGILWAPLGALFGLLGWGRALRLVALTGVPVLAAIGIMLLPSFLAGDLLELFAVIPGLAAGAWLVTGYSVPSLRESDRRPHAGTDASQIELPLAPARASRPDTHTLDAAISTRATPGHTTSINTPETSVDADAGSLPAEKMASRRRRRETVVGTPWMPRLLALTLVAVAVLGLVDFPYARLPLALAATLYVALLWWKPGAWLLLPPIALPLLDLAPWSGRLLFDEFDLFMLLTVAAGFWRRRVGRRKRPDFFLLFATGLFGASYLLGTVIGLLPPGPLDANAINGYWSGYNGLRLAKGLLWALAFAYLLQRNERDPQAALLGRFVPGMWLGLLGVCLIGLRERWQFSDLFDFTQTYRIVSTFSSMHTGGGYIEAYLVASIPFLWLGMRRWRPLLTAPLFALAIYITLSTVSRAGVLALAISLAILALGSWRQARGAKTGKAALLPSILLLAGGIGMLVAGASAGYLQQRLALVGQDWDTRLTHWKSSVAIMDADSQWFGMGLGSFPVTYLYRNPGGRPLATYNFLRESGNGYLKLGFGETLYMAQKIDIQASSEYRLSMDLRGAGGKLDVPLCEKQLLNSRTCVWSSLAFPPGDTWRHVEQRIASGEVGRGDWWSRPPIELVLHNSSTAPVEVDNIRLLDARGVDLIRNGDFSQGGDFWFFKTHSHLPWHIKNLWVETYFNQGVLGLIALVVLLMPFLGRCLPALWRGTPLAAVLTASLSGMLVVGMFDSLLDAPRIAMLFLSLAILGSMRSVVVPEHTLRRGHAHPDN